MYNLCRHVMPSGAQCKSPALRQQPCCYFHSRLRHATESRKKVKVLNLNLPQLEDHHAVQIALTQVLGAICSDDLDPRRASLLLRGLQTAARVADRLKREEDSEREVCDEVSDQGFAPEETVCEPPADCPTCEARSSCKNPRKARSEI
jgi:hypothetical protein